MNALIIDDEPAAREHLMGLLRDTLPHIRLVGEVNSAAEGRNFLREQSVDLVFLDVQMPGEDGFEFLDSIEQPDFLVVFVTAFDHYSIRAFRANAIDFLVKPVQAEELKAAEARLHQKKLLFEKGKVSNRFQDSWSWASQQSTGSSYPVELIIPDLKGFTILRVEEIVYLQSQNSYTIFHLEDGSSVVSSYGFTTYIELLDPSAFFRIHRSTIIHLGFMRSCVHETVFYAVMTGGQKLEVSRRRKNELLARVQARSRRNSSRQKA